MYLHNSGQIAVVAVDVVDLAVKTVDTQRQYTHSSSSWHRVTVAVDVVDLTVLTLQSKHLTQRGGLAIDVVVLSQNIWHTKAVAVYVTDIAVKTVNTERQWLLLLLRELVDVRAFDLTVKQLTQRGSECWCRWPYSQDNWHSIGRQSLLMSLTL